jgi:hypothetical protein
VQYFYLWIRVYTLGFQIDNHPSLVLISMFTYVIFAHFTPESCLKVVAYKVFKHYFSEYNIHVEVR